ncbi:hypothetical protein [Lacticaseibacillus brantae]|uniref:Uncharacterized protein n=1 Tax=Lacticaseibacillus brantae DSM 23927 TaxID=1423727 RepID=A0A0R2B612_9LACO|nr:hypothetical protein [Lacticaseibacillus brantae]KRM71705.1 hypothetical protein FC34_GL001362 [Lacticaseibacillus brantae DSM 23927]
MNGVFYQLLLLSVIALVVTLSLIGLEWKTKQLSRLNTGVKAVVAVVLVGLIVSLLIVR